MIDLKDAQHQLERMMQLDFGPRGREQRQEVLRLMCQSRTVMICAAAVTSWMDSGNTKFPKPGQLGEIITSLNVQHDQAVESEQRHRDFVEGSRSNGRRKEVWELTAEELDKIPNLLSGLPTSMAPRKAALDAWRRGGPKALNEWRMRHWAGTHGEKQPKPVAQIAEDYHGDF
jgi:hypothetical protein